MEKSARSAVASNARLRSIAPAIVRIFCTRDSRCRSTAPGSLITRGTREVPFPEIEIPDVEIPEPFLYEREELILGLSFALAKCARANRGLTDRDVIAAVGSIAKSYQTLVNSSLIYEPPTANVAHQIVAREIAREIETTVKEFREAEQRHLGHTRLRDSDVLKALVFLLRLGQVRTSGRQKSRAFIDFLFAQFPEKQSALAGPEDTGGRIVIP